MKKRIWDISPLISEELAVFPGDHGFARHKLMQFPEHHLELSWMESTLHIGAHADAPCHYDPRGSGIDSVDLDRYLGKCQVVTPVGLNPGDRVSLDHLPGFELNASRLLIRTLSFTDPKVWNPDFNSLCPDLVDHLAKARVNLVGIDTPSIDPASSQLLEAHSRVAHHSLSILEGLILTDVPDGLYELIALPLKISGADASPVRAILVQENANDF